MTTQGLSCFALALRASILASVDRFVKSSPNRKPPLDEYPELVTFFYDWTGFTGLVEVQEVSEALPLIKEQLRKLKILESSEIGWWEKEDMTFRSYHPERPAKPFSRHMADLERRVKKHLRRYGPPPGFESDFPEFK